MVLRLPMKKPTPNTIGPISDHHMCVYQYRYGILTQLQQDNASYFDGHWSVRVLRLEEMIPGGITAVAES